MSQRKDPLPGFEEAMGELSRIVSAVEEGKLGLEQTIDRYQRGQELLRRCRRLLDDAQRQLDTLPHGPSSADQPGEQQQG